MARRSIALVIVSVAAALAACAPATSSGPGAITPIVAHPTRGSAAGPAPLAPELVDASAACGLDGPPTDAAQCECVGGSPRALVGDGELACDPGDSELGRITYGAAGGVCCQPVVPLAVAPLPPGAAGRRPAVAIAEAYPGAAAEQVRASRRGFRSDLRLTD